jgi:signal transduction histidine kinase
MMKSEVPLTAAARRHVRLFLRNLAPVVGRLDRRFHALLRARRYDPAHTRALLAITPAAAARSRSLAAFLEGVRYYGRRLAKLNMTLEDVTGLLAAFGSIVQETIAGHHAPAAEQLHLVTAQTLQRAYYQVREAEAQVFYGLYHAEAEAEGLNDLLGRMVRVAARAFAAREGRLVLETPRGCFARELYSEDRAIVWGGHAACWSFPVRSMASIQLAFDKPYPWLPREQMMMRAVAERCAIAIERSRLEGAARHAEEQERRRIGRELHDDTAQSLLLLRLQLEMIERDAPEPLRRRLQESRVITERAVEDLRRTIAALSPALLERLGLERALRQLAARFAKQNAAQVDVRISSACCEASPGAQEVIYRVAQESLQNISKHAGATRVNLWLTSADKRFRLRVRDNGAGLNGDAAMGKPMSFGLAGMRERATLLGGTLAVRSIPGKGVAVTLDLPRAAATGEI